VKRVGAVLVQNVYRKLQKQQHREQGGAECALYRVLLSVTKCLKCNAEVVVENRGV
jgi:hypothetical protein